MSKECAAANEETSVNRLFSFADRDIYGFPLPIPAPAHVKTEQRDKNWEEFFGLLRRSDADGNPEDGRAIQLVTLLRKGLSCKRRVAVWQVLSRSTARQRIEDKRYDDKYYDMLKRQVEATGNVIVFDQIEKDLRRTFPGNPFFECEAGQQKLRSVLRCFALHSLRYVDAPIGYCQSLNYVAGVLLLLIGEEEAFYLLLQLVENILPRRYYCAGMDDIIVDQRVLLTLLRLKFPDLHHHFQRLQLPVELVATRWLLCLFVNCVPIETVLRIWDCVFFWGSDMLFRVILAALKLNYTALMASTDACDAMACLTDSLRNMHDPDLLIQTCFEPDADFHAHTLKQLRAQERDSRKHLHTADDTSSEIGALSLPSFHPTILTSPPFSTHPSSRPPVAAVSAAGMIEPPSHVVPRPEAVLAAATHGHGRGMGASRCRPSARGSGCGRTSPSTSSVANISTATATATDMNRSIQLSLLDHPLLQLRDHPPTPKRNPPDTPEQRNQPRRLAEQEVPQRPLDAAPHSVCMAMAEHFAARFVPDPSKLRHRAAANLTSFNALVPPTTVRPSAALAGTESGRERDTTVHWLARMQDPLTRSLVEDYIR